MKLSRDQAIPLGGLATLHPRETINATGTLGAPNAEVIIPADGVQQVSIDLRGTFNLTIVLEATIDGANWFPLPFRTVNAASVAWLASVSVTAAAIYNAPVSVAVKAIRVRASAWTSGAAVVTLLGSTAALPALGEIAPLMVTNTGAAGAAVTLTLPAPGAGLRQYLNEILIIRSASVVLTAAAAPVVVTSTNLPGSPAWTFGADAAVQGADKTITQGFPRPLAATAQNTAVTIVCPVTTGVIWRVTASYHTAP